MGCRKKQDFVLFHAEKDLEKAQEVLALLRTMEMDGQLASDIPPEGTAFSHAITLVRKSRFVFILVTDNLANDSEAMKMKDELVSALIYRTSQERRLIPLLLEEKRKLKQRNNPNFAGLMSRTPLNVNNRYFEQNIKRLKMKIENIVDTQNQTTKDPYETSSVGNCRSEEKQDTAFVASVEDFRSTTNEEGIGDTDGVDFSSPVKPLVPTSMSQDQKPSKNLDNNFLIKQGEDVSSEKAPPDRNQSEKRETSKVFEQVCFMKEGFDNEVLSGIIEEREDIENCESDFIIKPVEDALSEKAQQSDKREMDKVLKQVRFRKQDLDDEFLSEIIEEREDTGICESEVVIKPDDNVPSQKTDQSEERENGKDKKQVGLGKQVRSDEPLMPSKFIEKRKNTETCTSACEGDEKCGDLSAKRGRPENTSCNTQQRFVPRHNTENSRLPIRGPC